MDDFKNKTDDELREIMRAGLSNQYVPSSAYNRAKQELEFRAAAAHEQDKGLSITAKAVLRSIAESKKSTDATGNFMQIEMLEHQFGKRRMPQVNAALQQLFSYDYIEELEGYRGVFRITPFGASYLADTPASTSVISYSHISNSNIAHASQHVSQVINIQDLPEDIQKNIEELRDAAAQHDSSRMKKAFAYIADKALDVAIAITLGHLRLG